MTYYVRVATRGSAKKGTPQQALNYITDGHDARRDSSYSDAELHYIARMDPGWKADLEGGRVPLVGFGTLAGEPDYKQLAERFEDACQPYHDIRGTTGYKSITLTVPKEVSLYAEGHREEAKAAMNAAVQTALERAFPGLRYSAVAAIHTRNQSGEIHYHVHVLVGKFAEKEATGRMVSLSSKAGGNTGRARLKEMKVGWQEGIEKEFRERLQLGIEQRTARSPVALILPDGQRLDPLNRDSRREIEKQLSPYFTEATANGEAVTRQFRWSAMDDRIFEIASGAKGLGAWDPDAFKELFPEQQKFFARYEARVRTLQTIGYLSAEGKICPPFRLHFAAHHGVLTPELQRVRLDLQSRLAKEKHPDAKNLRPQNFWENLNRYEGFRKRLDRLGLKVEDIQEARSLGISRADINKALAEAESKRPTRENLDRLRAEARRLAALAPLPKSLPQTKTIIRAYVDLQRARVQRIYLITSGVIQFWKFSEKHALATKLKLDAESHMYWAKEKRIAQLARAMRPVLWLGRIVMPRDARRLDQALSRCSKLARRQEMRREGREVIKRAYDQWRENNVRPIQDLKKAALGNQPIQEKPGQVPGTVVPPPASAELRVPRDVQRPELKPEEVENAVSLYRRGLAACLVLQPKEQKITQALLPWKGKEEQLIKEVLQQANGQPSLLDKEVYSAAIRAGRMGNLLTQEEFANKPRIPESFKDAKKDLEILSARLQAFGQKSPITPANLGALAPSQVREQLNNARKAGLLDEGPGWTGQGSAARTFVLDMGKQIEKTREVDRRLEDQLIARKGGPT